MAIYIILSGFILICCLLLVLAVLIQNPKGGGLSQTFGGAGTQIMGARKTADFLEKATWTLAIALCTLSIFSAFAIPRGTSNESNIRTDLTVDESVRPIPQMPSIPMPDFD